MNKFKRPSRVYYYQNQSATPEQSALRPKAVASRNQQLAAAACHLSILLNLFTYAGGIVVCIFFYLAALGSDRYRARFLVEQASRALIYQAVTWGLIGAGWACYRVVPEWLGGFFFYPYCAFVWFVAILIALFKAARCL